MQRAGVVTRVVMASWFDWLRKRCPACGRRGLRARQSLLWSGRDEHGGRTGGARTYGQCPHCGYRGVWELDGEVLAVDDEEWQEAVGVDLPEARTKRPMRRSRNDWPGWVAVAAAAAALSACGGRPPVLDRTSTALPTSSLAEAGMDPARWDRAVAEVDRADLRQDSMVLVVDGAVVAEHHWPPYARNALHDLRSSTKSITALLVGMAIDRGVLPSVRAEVAGYFPDYRPHDSWRRYRALTIEDLLTMRSGLDCDDWRRSAGNEERMYGSDDWLGFFFAVPAVGEPGQAFSYCTAGVVVLGEIVSRAAGVPLPRLAAEWLFEPLGIRDARWDAAPRGVTDAGGHLRLSVDGLAKIGLLVLRRGWWNGERLVSGDYLRAMLTGHSDLGPVEKYGYLWVVNDAGTLAWQTRGNGGQYAFVFPGLDAVVAFTASNYNDGKRMAAPFDLTRRFILPMLRGRRGASEP